jgi:hypothetical protein
MVRLHDPKPVPKKPEEAQLLPARKDRFGGLHLELTTKLLKTPPVKVNNHIVAHVLTTCLQFRQLLKDSLEAWTKQGIRGVWAKLPVSAGKCIPVMLEQVRRCASFTTPFSLTISLDM